MTLDEQPADPGTQPDAAFRRAFSRARLLALAGPVWFERGVHYAEQGRVERLRSTTTGVSARVKGSYSYEARLWVTDDDAAFACTCPVGRDDLFCKHLVAMALEAMVTRSAPDPAPIDVAAYLQALPHASLVDLLLECAGRDESLYNRLRIAAARSTDGTPVKDAYVDAIDSAFYIDDFLDYDEMYDFKSDVDMVLASLQDLLDSGSADLVVELAEYAVGRIDEALERVDDSGGWMGEISSDLADLHLAACEAAHPDPVALAQRLFEGEVSGIGLDFYYGAASTYARVLGKTGMAHYRHLAQSAWDALPPLDSSGARTPRDPGRYQITSIMERLTKQTGDPDALVAVLARDQTTPYQFVRIADVLRDAGRHEEALDWALKGLALHGYSDLRLVEAAVQEYHRAGRTHDNVELLWATYTANPGLRTYEFLSEHATRAGTWEDLHDRALEILRAKIPRPTSGAPTGVGRLYSEGASQLVSALLFDGNVDQAWLEATNGGCTRDLWFRLATLREQDHPEDAIPIWQSEVQTHIAAKNNKAYAAAVTLIERVQRLMLASDRQSEFSQYVADLRLQHKAKRNLMKLFTQRGW